MHMLCLKTSSNLLGGVQYVSSIDFLIYRNQLQQYFWFVLHWMEHNISYSDFLIYHNQFQLFFFFCIGKMETQGPRITFH